MSDSPPLENHGSEASSGAEKSPRKKKSLLRFFLKSVVLLLLLILLPIGFLLIRPTTFDLSRFAEEIVRQITEALGREVAIDGDILFMTGFVPSIRVEKITLENPEGWGAEGNFAYLERFQTSVDLIELFNSEINIDDIHIEGLTLSLERNADGLGNWEGLAGFESDSETGEAIISDLDENDVLEGLDLDFRELGAINVENISVSYRDPEHPRKTVLELDHLVGHARYRQAMQLSIDGTFLKLPFHGDIEAGTLTDLRARRAEWPIGLKGKLGSNSLHMEGQLSAKDFSVPGVIRFDLDIPHIDELMPITGELPDFGSLHLEGEARRTSEHHYSLPDLTGHVGKEDVSGSLKLDLSGKYPRIDGGLTIAAIDVKDLQKLRNGGDGRKAKKEGVGEVGEEILENLPEAMLPVMGRLRLDIGAVKGTAEEIDLKDIELEITTEKGLVVAEVNLNFVGTPLRGGLTLKREKFNKTLSFDLNLKSEKADLSDLIAFYTKHDRYKGSFERMRYKIGGTGETLVDAWFARRVDLEVDEAKMTYRGDGEEWRFFVSRGTMLRKGREPGEIKLRGVISEAPFDVTLTYESEILGNKTGTYFHSIGGQVADLEFRIENKIDEEAERGDANFSFFLRGGRLDKLDLIYEMDLPPMGPYSAKGVFQKTGSVIEFHQVALEIGSSRLKGSWRYEERDKRPRLSLDLNAATLQLDDFAFDQWSPTESKKEKSLDLLDKGRLAQATTLPSILSHQVLSEFDMLLKLEVGEVLSGKDKLGRGSLTAVLEDSRLKVEPLKLAVPGGYFEGNLLFYPKANGTLDWKLHLNAEAFELGVIARRAKPDATLSALANIEADLSAEDASFGRPQLKVATGKLNLEVCPQNVDAGSLDIWATNLIWAILPSIGSGNQSKINCLIARLRLENGVMFPEMLALDTSTLRVGAEGQIDLAGDQYDLRLTPFPKRPQMFSMELPVGVKGTLDAPKIETGSLASVRALGRIAANSVLFPVKFIVDERLPEDGSDFCPCVDAGTPKKRVKESAPPKKKEGKKGFFRRLFEK